MVDGVELLPPQPASPTIDAEPMRNIANAANRSPTVPRRRIPNGRNRSARTTPPPMGPNGREWRAPVVVVVPNVRVVLAAVLVPVKVRLVGAKTHVAPVGSVPQLKVTVPEYPPTGVPVMTAVPVEPFTTVRVVGVTAKVMAAGTLTVMVEAEEVAAAKVLSPL